MKESTARQRVEQCHTFPNRSKRRQNCPRSYYGTLNAHPRRLFGGSSETCCSLVESRERQARLTLADIGDRKRRAVIAKATTAAFGSNCNGESITGGPRGDRFHGRGILTRLMGMVALTATGDPSQQATEVREGREGNGEGIHIRSTLAASAANLNPDRSIHTLYGAA